MLSYFILIAFIIDVLVFIYVMLKSFVERENNKKVQEALLKKTEESMDKSKSKPEQFGIAIGVFIFGLLLITIAILPVIMLIIKWIQQSFIVGLRYFLIYSLLWPGLRVTIRTITKKKTIINEKHRLTIFMYLSGVFIAIIYTIFGFSIEFYDIILYYSESNSHFANTLSIIMPALVIISTVLTYYCAISKMALLKIEKINYPHWTMKYPLVLTIVVVSIYTSIIYITELSMEKKLAIGYISVSDTISVTQNILAAALIPLIIGVFLNVNSEKKLKKTIDESK
jgi:hypothetical protein